MNALEQDKLSTNVIVRGIPEVEENDSDKLHTVASSVVESLNVTARIAKVSRIGKTNTEAPRPIKIQFHDDKMQSDVLRAKRALNLNCAQLKVNEAPIGSESDIVFINEDLTPENARLYRAVREIKKKGKIKFAWTRNGQVLARICEGSKVTRINTEDDIRQLNNDAEHKKNPSSTNQLKDLFAGVVSRTRSNSRKRAGDNDHMASTSVEKTNPKKVKGK